MFGLTRARQREREEKDTRVFGIRASTGEPQQMGYTKDILSYFTTHSSHCLFTNWYVRNVCLCAVCFFFLCPFPYASQSAYSVCSVPLCLCTTMLPSYIFARVFMYVYVHVGVGCFMPHQPPLLDPRGLFAFLLD